MVNPLRETAKLPGFLEALRNEGPKALGTPWDQILVWFLRAMAIVWILKGLGSWAILLGVLHSGLPFDARPLSFQATVVYFAVIDLVAAIGLWLTSTWGGVMWLLAVMSHLILTIFFPRIVGTGILMILAFLVLIVAYFVISWFAARMED